MRLDTHPDDFVRIDVLTNVAARSYIRRMNAVGLRELKNRLSEYVNRVKAGEAVLVTDRGQAVAELRPVATKDQAGLRRLSLADLAREGLLTLGKPNHRRLYPPLTRIGRRSSSELLDEERGER